MDKDHPVTQWQGNGWRRLRRKLRRSLRAQLRDARVLLRESQRSLVWFVILVFGGALAFYSLYRDPQTGAPIRFAHALYAAFNLLFLQATLEFPEHGLLQLLYFAIPILGLFVVVDGLVRFGVALTNKQERGQKWQIAMASTYSNHVILCGLGKVGYRVAQQLLRFDREVVAVEADPSCRFIEKAEALGIPVIIADARQPENLIKAGIQQADAIIPCTDHELANLDIALDARELNPGIKIVMRMADVDLAQRIEKGFGIHTTYSVSGLAAPTIAAASMRVNIKSSFYVGSNLLHISEVTVKPGSALANMTVQQLEQTVDLSVISSLEDGQTRLHPANNLSLPAGTQVLVLASLDSLLQLEKLNKNE
jgi:voltage-gated potassium channel